jgi:hypothetical protein
MRKRNHSRAKTQRAPRKENKKFETRNPKQIPMIQKHKIPNQFVSDFEIWL